MSDNAESPTETQKEESHTHSDDSPTNEDKKKSKQACVYVENPMQFAKNISLQGLLLC